MIRSSVLAIVSGILALRLGAQTPATTPLIPQSSTIVLDLFDSVSQWAATPAEGVELTIHSDSSGLHGRSMRLDFDFHGHGGYAVVHRAFNLAVPQNYEFTFAVRGEAVAPDGSRVGAPKNTLEFKLIDSTGDNVWWSNNPDFAFRREWQTVSRRKRQISFAWGPTADKSLRQFAAIEFAITAGSGGKGSVWLDDLALTPLDPDVAYNLTPRVTASSQQGESIPARTVDSDLTTAWRSAKRTGTMTDSIDMDFLKRREFGGVVIDWEPGRRSMSYTLRASRDGLAWTDLYSVKRSFVAPVPQPRDYIQIPNGGDARSLRIVLTNPEGSDGFGIREIGVKPIDWATTENDLFFAMAKDAPRGSYPRYLSSEQSYWTVLGVDRDSAEALVNEEGMLEVGRGKFSIEPFLYADGKLLTWNDVKTSVAANPEALPLPQVMWSAKDLDLSITPFVAGPVDSSVLYARYRIINNSTRSRKLTLYLAIRPLQVNPPWQFLNRPGGAADIAAISVQGSTAKVADMYVRSLASPSGFGAVGFFDGSVVDWLRAGKLPTSVVVQDPAAHASAAFSYQLQVAARSTSSPIDIAVPLHGGDLNPGQSVDAQLERVRGEWREKLGRVTITLPPSASRYTQTMRTQLADILINRDGAAIQPGSRSYSRSWIRDGSLTSTALLRLGHAADVKEFIDWYAPFQYDNGKVPCCVDEHGATPVPENDSHGEFIYLVAEYYRHTGDKAELEKMWPHVLSAAMYMDSLRHERMTDQYTVGANKVFYGLLPQSISHEGYSAKPVHSYWDDFFALRGFKDAAFIAQTLDKPEAGKLAGIRNSFRTNLFESIKAVLISRHIDYIPGSVELADFDPTSTTIAVSPVGEAGRLPGPLLMRTFERYYQEARQRAAGIRSWDAYTPYELRTVGTMVQLGQRARAHELLDFFFTGQRPAEWHQWAEVVYRDPKTPKFIGDMPHTWVGSDYIRSFLDMLAYERESDSSLVIGAGVKDDWVKQDPGVRVANLSTMYGPLNYDMRAFGNAVTVNLRSGIKMPPGGVVIFSPLSLPILSAAIDGVPAAVSGSEVRVRKLPAIVTIRYGR
ncbi:MAG: discoidin domain-containing protein [Gemmatimonadaceae bacterium]